MTDTPDPTLADAQQAAQAADAFGADLYHLLTAGPTGNMIFSPVSISAALRMALLGARGETAAQLAATLHLAGPQAAADGLRLLSAGLARLSSGDVTVRAPNTMWAEAGLPLRPEFTATLAGMAAAQVRSVDFVHAAEQARLEINETIAEQTAGRIQDLLGRGVVDAATRLVLANAVYLKAAWAHPFPRAATADMPFHSGAGAEIAVRMMRLATRLGYRRGDGYQAVILPYAGRELAMAVILPDGPLTPLEAGLAHAGVRGLLAGAAVQQVRLSMPGFKVTAQANLRRPLETLGAELAFTSGADFSGITSAERVWISEVAHMAYIDVDEDGTEAAAATAVVVATARFAVPSAPPVEVIVDRPFLFAITNTATGLPLFLGRVTNPLAG
jgi:serpin B